MSFSPEGFRIIMERLTPEQLAECLKAPPVKPLTPLQQERAKAAEAYRDALEQEQH